MRFTIYMWKENWQGVVGVRAWEKRQRTAADQDLAEVWQRYELARERLGVRQSAAAFLPAIIGRQ
ncbi:MAG: hypothetical protein JWQ04_1031 [Pedosphaera sp.]|nr:hypothetical protein [Pedosphaera sp.]